MTSEEICCVVTGGRGFAARHLVEMLIRYEIYSVRIADLSATIDLEPAEKNGVLGDALRAGLAVYIPTIFGIKIKCVKHVKGLKLYSTWQRLIPPLTIISFIIRSMLMAYFITNMEPIKFWEFVSPILEGLGYESTFVIMPIAHMVELVYKLLGPYGMSVPQLTPSRVADHLAVELCLLK